MACMTQNTHYYRMPFYFFFVKPQSTLKMLEFFMEWGWANSLQVRIGLPNFLFDYKIRCLINHILCRPIDLGYFIHDVTSANDFVFIKPLRIMKRIQFCADWGYYIGLVPRLIREINVNFYIVHKSEVAGTTAGAESYNIDRRQTMPFQRTSQTTGD